MRSSESLPRFQTAAGVTRLPKGCRRFRAYMTTPAARKPPTASQTAMPLWPPCPTASCSSFLHRRETSLMPPRLCAEACTHGRSIAHPAVRMNKNMRPGEACHSLSVGCSFDQFNLSRN